jgi:hypothetical protein
VTKLKASGDGRLFKSSSHPANGECDSGQKNPASALTGLLAGFGYCPEEVIG